MIYLNTKNEQIEGKINVYSDYIIPETNQIEESNQISEPLISDFLDDNWDLDFINNCQTTVSPPKHEKSSSKGKSNNHSQSNKSPRARRVTLSPASARAMMLEALTGEDSNPNSPAKSNEYQQERNHEENIIMDSYIVDNQVKEENLEDQLQADQIEENDDEIEIIQNGIIDVNENENIDVDNENFNIDIDDNFCYQQSTSNNLIYNKENENFVTENFNNQETHPVIVNGIELDEIKDSQIEEYEGNVNNNMAIEEICNNLSTKHSIFSESDVKYSKEIAHGRLLVRFQQAKWKYVWEIASIEAANVAAYKFNILE